MGGCILSALNRRSVRELGSIPLNASLFVCGDGQSGGRVAGCFPLPTSSMAAIGMLATRETQVPQLGSFVLAFTAPSPCSPHPTPHPNLLVVSAILAHAHDSDFCLFGNYDSAISFLPFLIADSREIAFLKISCLFVVFNLVFPSAHPKTPIHPETDLEVCRQDK